MTNFNTPIFRNERNEQTIKRYVHSPVDVDDRGLRIQISENGQVTFTQAVRDEENPDRMKLVSITMSASSVLKAERLLKDTRSVKYLPVGEAEKEKV